MDLTGSLKIETLLGGRAPHAARVTMGGQPREAGKVGVVLTKEHVKLRLIIKMGDVCGKEIKVYCRRCGLEWKSYLQQGYHDSSALV